MNHRDDAHCPAKEGRVPRPPVEIIVLGGSGMERTLDGLKRARTATPWRHRVVARPSWSAMTAARPTGGGDVVLLRAGVEVYDGWLDRLSDAARSSADNATATPFGGGRLAAYPVPPAETAALDAIAADSNRGLRIRLPFPGGDCTFLRGEFLDGRPPSGGWKHVLAADVFVHLEGPAAADPAWLNRADRASAADLASHLRIDPARPLRRRLDLGRLAAPGPAFLMVTHYGGGGTGKHVRDMAAGLEREGVRVLLLCPTDDGRLRLERFGGPAMPDLVFDPQEEYYTLLTAIHRIGCVHVHVQHLLGHPPETMRLVTDLGLPYDVTVHDYHYACPRIHLHDHAGRYCGEPSPAGCDACLARNGDFLGARGPVTIGAWRGRHAVWLAGARRVFVPHAEVGRAYESLLSARSLPRTAGISENRSSCMSASRSSGSGESCRGVALLGVLAAHKGAEVLMGCASDAAARRLPLSFQVIGATTGQHLRWPANVAISGEYREEEVFELMRARRVHCALFLSIVPETYSYTLSIAQAAGLYALGFSLGAIGARIRESGWGEVFPLTTAPGEINDRLLAVAERLRGGAVPPPRVVRRYESLSRDYYEIDLTAAALVPAPAATCGRAA